MEAKTQRIGYAHFDGCRKGMGNHGRSAAARRAVFTLTRFDRVRVLTSAPKRLSVAGAPVALRLGPRPP